MPDEKPAEGVNVFAEALAQLVADGMPEAEATDKLNKVGEAGGFYDLEDVLAKVRALD